MRLFKTDYDDSYFNTINKLRPFQQIAIKQKARLIRSFKSHGDLLEIGCGKGKLLNELKNEYNIMGIDVSKFAIEKASNLVDRRKLKIMDIEKANLKEKYDLILAFDVLEHLRDPKKVIMKVKKALKKDGIFILSVPNNYGFYGKFMTRLFDCLDKTHISTFKREEWIKLVNEANFKSKIINHSLFGFFKSDLAKHFSFNLIIVAQKN